MRGKHILLSFIIITLAFSHQAPAQTGGESTYTFLLLTSSPRASAMGAEFAGIWDNDPSLAVKLPALINPEMNNKAALNFLDYFADIRGGFAAYGFNTKKLGAYLASVEFIDYGRFIRTDNSGQILGDFYANELSFNIGWGRALSENYSIGANLKIIQSNLDAWHSTGLAVDLNGMWHSDNGRTTALVLISNLGREVNNYSSDEAEPLPLRLRAGVSHKPEHMPFRFNIVLEDLQQWNLRYSDPTNPILSIDPLTGEVLEPSNVSKFADNAMRHLILGGEFIPSKSFSVRFGYNYRHRQEMKVSARPGMVGFSFGVGMKISKFRFDFSHINHSMAGGFNMFGISTDISAFSR
jgi:hypothetical protein